MFLKLQAKLPFKEMRHSNLCFKWVNQWSFFFYSRMLSVYYEREQRVWMLFWALSRYKCCFCFCFLFLRNLLLGNTPCGSLRSSTPCWVCGNPTKPCLLFPWATSQDCVCRKRDAMNPTRKSKLAVNTGADTTGLPQDWGQPGRQ